MAVRVSVIIPTYKSAAWVEETLESVVRQTYPLSQLEIIVVDDASPDDSAAVARRFLEKQPVKSQVVVREKNGGIGAARNAGWQRASGSTSSMRMIDVSSRPSSFLGPPRIAASKSTKSAH
jgi:CDP-glycerol glycerophosphotransferase